MLDFQTLYQIFLFRIVGWVDKDGSTKKGKVDAIGLRIIIQRFI